MTQPYDPLTPDESLDLEIYKSYSIQQRRERISDLRQLVDLAEAAAKVPPGGELGAATLAHARWALPKYRAELEAAERLLLMWESP